MTNAQTVKEIDPRTLKGWLDAGEALLVDVRPPEAYAAERIAGARSLPLLSVEPVNLPDVGTRRLVFQCQVGISSEKAGRRLLMQQWSGDVYHLGGGITAWKEAGLAVERGASAGVSIPRQVQVVAGSLVLVGVGLGAAVSPWFLALSALVGAGLVFAGATGRCGMARALGALPHNRRSVNV